MNSTDQEAPTAVRFVRLSCQLPQKRAAVRNVDTTVSSQHLGSSCGLSGRVVLAMVL